MVPGSMADSAGHDSRPKAPVAVGIQRVKNLAHLLLLPQYTEFQSTNRMADDIAVALGVHRTRKNLAENLDTDSV